MHEKIGSAEINNIENDTLLSLAALFTGNFSIDWVMELSGQKASKLISALDQGIEQGILSQSQAGIFFFNSPKIRDEYLSQINITQKQELSRRAREIVIQAEPDDTEVALTMAHHLLQGSNDRSCDRKLIQVGDILRRGNHQEEAYQCYQKVILDLQTSKDDQTDRLFIEAVLKYARLLPDINDNEGIIIDVIKEAITRAKELDDYPSEILLKMHLGEYEWYQGRFNVATRHFNEGWTLAQELGNPAMLRSALIFRIFFLWWQGRYQEIVNTYEQLVPEVERYPTGSFAIFAATLLGSSYVACGKVTQGFGLLNGLLSHCRNMKNQENFMKVSLHLALSFIEIGRLDEATPYYEMIRKKGLKTLSSRYKNAILDILSYAYLLNKDFKRALEFFPQSFSTTQALLLSGSRTHYIFSFLMLMEKGQLPKITDVSMEKMINKVTKTGNVHARSVGYLFKAHFLKNKGRPPHEILKALKQSIKWTKESGHVIQLAKIRLETARLYLSIGDKNNAKKEARKAYEVLEPINQSLIPDDLTPLVRDHAIQENLLGEIIRLGQEIVTIRDNRELAQRILSTVNQITGAERGAIFMVDDSTGEIELKAAKFLTANDVSHKDFKPSMEIIRKTISKGIAQITKMNGSAHVDTIQFHEGPRIKSCFCVPMIYKNKIVGALYHDYCLFTSSIKESDLSTLSFFAGQAAIALDNAHAYEQIHRLNEKLKGEKEYYLEQHLQGLQYNDFIGKSQKIQRVFDQVDRVAREDTSVLILGETGVGKELLARIIHRESPRKGKPFIRTDCSTFSPSLIASELFGHERGAFTGATYRRTGLFELANGGTLFLDEISNTPMEVQMQLLRVLQTREFQRVGGVETIRSNFRLLTASNRDLKEEVKAGRFREDLYYRLNVFPIVIPPLRDRKDDISLLSLFFLKKYASRMRKNLEDISAKEMEKLIKYDWPGNIRELQHIIERGVILSSDSYFRVPELATHNKHEHSKTESVSLNEIVRHHIIWALEKTGGKISGKGSAAELLDINYGTLRSKMKKLGIHLNRNPESI